MAKPTDPQQLSDARYSVIADLNRGEPVPQVASYLVNNGWEETDALQFVQVIKDALDAHEEPPRPWIAPPTEPEVQKKQDKYVRQVCTRNMNIGAMWFFGGFFVTGLTYAMASAGGGVYVVTWGAMIYGVVRFMVGFNRLRGLPKQS